ncbi:hypothetical protein [Noviherbaspirillum soli]|uniref:hypothetical protein n=1 Tax=Noviherbaspirillum soli TaxID=1064518 RepID=UPI00188B88E4|nr:hypothetical protein [Noviherbaspirillum soli]
MKSKRKNPFTGLVDTTQTTPKAALVPWKWDLRHMGFRDYDFSNLEVRPKLFRPLLAALWEMEVACIPKKSGAGIATTKAALTYLNQYIEQHSPRITDIAEINTHWLLDFRASLFADTSLSGGTQADYHHKIKNCLLLLQSKESPIPHAVAAHVEIPLRALRNEADDLNPTQPYTNNEVARLTAACKAAINELYDRLDHGKQLLARGVDPRLTPPPESRQIHSDGWLSKENILWYFVHVRNSRHPASSMAREKYESEEEWLYVSSFIYAAKREHMDVFGGYREVHRSLYCESFDLTPFVMLFALKTGLNPESIMELERDCLLDQTPSGKKTRLRYRKGRGTHEEMIKAFSHKGPLSPIGIIKTVLELTAPLVHLAKPEHRNSLWLCYKAQGTDRKIVDSENQKYPVSVMDSRTVLNNANGRYTKKPELQKFKGLLHERNVLADDGSVLVFRFRESRTTKATRDYIGSGGNLAWVSESTLKHHGAKALDTTTGYLNNPATAHVHEQAIVSAQTKMMESALGTVVPDEPPSTQSEIRSIAQKLAESEEKVIALFNGEQDVFVAQCRDFYNKPGGRPDTPCSDPWECFTCKNALWTSRILPRLIAFMWFMEDQTKLLTSIEWSEKFGLPHRVITTEILPRFSKHTVEWAKQQAKDEPFYVPTSLKQVP